MVNEGEKYATIQECGYDSIETVVQWLQTACNWEFGLYTRSRSVTVAPVMRD